MLSEQKGRKDVQKNELPSRVCADDARVFVAGSGSASSIYRTD
jgi:hypothetical protein